MKKIALVYDFDYTLADGYHPTSILARKGVNTEEFWKKVGTTQKREFEQGEKTALDIIWLAHFMHEIRHGKLQGLTNKDLKESGKDVNKTLYPGIPTFFDNIKEEHKSVDISHNIVTVGIKTVIEGSKIATHVDNIYGYTFFDDLTEGPEIDEIRSTNSSTEKIRSVISISYGNSEEGFEYPIKNTIYFGDGQTDIPVFRFIKKRGGTSICVYDPNKEGAQQKAEKLKEHVNYIVPADYRKGTELWNNVNEVIKRME